MRCSNEPIRRSALRTAAGATTVFRRAQRGTAGLGFALRIGVELVGGLIVGGGLGLLLDRWLGTTPWLMVLFFLLGAAAGFLNVYRTVTGLGHGVGYRTNKTEKNGNDRPGG